MGRREGPGRHPLSPPDGKDASDDSEQRSPYDAEKRPLELLPVHAYGRALRALEAAGVPSLVGGGLAMAYYGYRRPTKDLDIFIRRQDVERALHALAAVGFTVFDMDVEWLRKAKINGVEIDLIVESRGPISLIPQEVERGLHVVIEGVPMTIFAVEDLLLRKIYTRRDDGVDWLDALLLLDQLPALDWSRLERDTLDPRPLAAFLLLVEVRRQDAVPAHVVERQLLRAQATRARRAVGPRGLPGPDSQNEPTP